MAQHDYNIANQSGAAFRTDLNNSLSAILSNNSGSSQPATRTAYMFWADTSNNVLKMRNSSNSAWITLRTLSGNIDTTPLGVGTDSPGSYNSAANSLVVYESGADSGITIATSSSSYDCNIYFADGTSSGANNVGRIQYDHGVNDMAFWVNGYIRGVFGQNGTLYNMALNNTFYAQSSASAGTTYTLFSGYYNSTLGQEETGVRSVAIYTNGNIQNTNNSYGQLSDIKLKTNIVDASSQWNDFKAFRFVNYNLISDPSLTQLGVIAQEIENVSPGLVYEVPELDENDVPTGVVTKGVKYSILYLKAAKALQEAMERIETLEAKVAALENA